MPNTAIEQLNNKVDYGLSESEKMIIQQLNKKEFIKRLDVEDQLSVSSAMAVKLLKGLLDKSLIKKVGQAKNTKYRLNQ